KLARKVGHLPARGHAIGPAIVTADRAPAGSRSQESEEQAQSGGFAGPIRAEKADDFAGGDVEVQLIEGAVAAVVFGQTFRAKKHEAVIPTGGKLCFTAPRVEARGESRRTLVPGGCRENERCRVRRR